ncbi:DUF1214 domain-containing protein [Flavobacterium johnsoniae]|uniref:DUF1254 domain-containing protein n=1 Tax=Flavobacterium johnsoniae TaxID=986 RepID=A0A1J7C2M0_FLAJO|nr:DUF1254 domain-containing protein [Flavobacterium johnsoniae]OIV39961.1 hypothetical protein BKM63_21400 [Flavobacterium johnsoniae]
MTSNNQVDFPYEISEKIIYSRALQSVVWGIPAVNYDRIYQAFLSVGGSNNQIAYSTKPGNWKNQLLTPNADAVFALVFFDTMISGPLVLEIPQAAEFTILGTIMTCWQLPLEDVGTDGADQGNGSHYLILPPNYKDTVPTGYTVLSSPNSQGYALLRCMPKSDKDIDLARAIIYMEQIKLYPLANLEVGNSTSYIDITDKNFDAVIKYDISFFESLHRIVQEEPWLERDMLMVDILKEIGIEKDKPFTPDVKKRKILLEAVSDAKEYLDKRYEGYKAFYKSSKWFFPADPSLLNSWFSGFKENDIYPIDARAAAYYWGFGSLKRTKSTISQFYLFLICDRYGNKLDGSQRYKLTLPADVPVNKYWSVTAYNRSTHSYIKGVAYSSRSSLSQDLRINKNDGTITIFFGPEPPDELHSNWIPVRANENFELVFRFYGVEKPILEKKWILPDVESL